MPVTATTHLLLSDKSLTWKRCREISYSSEPASCKVPACNLAHERAVTNDNRNTPTYTHTNTHVHSRTHTHNIPSSFRFGARITPVSFLADGNSRAQPRKTFPGAMSTAHLLCAATTTASRMSWEGGRELLMVMLRAALLRRSHQRAAVFVLLLLSNSSTEQMFWFTFYFTAAYF